MEIPNILVLNHTGWLGGAELCLLGYLKRTGIPHERITCVTGHLGPLHEELAALGLEAISLRIPIPGLSRDAAEKVRSYNGLARAIRRISRIVRQREIGLVYANSYRAALLWAPLSLVLPRTRLITHVRDRIEARIKREIVVRESDRLIAISRYVQGSLGSAARTAGKITLIPTGVDTGLFRENGSGRMLRREFGISPDSFLFGMFCQVLPWKGVREYIEAALRLAASREDVTFLMVGDASFSGQDSYFDAIRQLVSEHGLSGRIIFTGFRKDIERFLSSVDVVVSASTNEPLGQTLLQAMAMGKPVIAARSGGPLEIVVHEETGLFFEPGDSPGLVHAMLWLCENREEALRMGKKGRERFSEHFLDMDEMTRRLDEVILGCLGA